VRGWALLDAGGMAGAAHLDEWATRSAPDDRAAMNDARRALGEEPDPSMDTGMSFGGRTPAR
jgi:hypothetical protein